MRISVFNNIKTRFKSKLVRETGGSFFLKISQAGFSFLSTVLLARILGAEGYGIYAYALAFVTLISIPAQAGLPTLVVRETARGMAEGKLGLVQGVWRWSAKVAVLISGGLILGIGIGFLVLKGCKLNIKEWTFLWALLLIPPVSLGNLRGAALRGLHKLIIGQLPEFFIRPFLFLLFLCAVVFFFHHKLTPPQAMIFNVVAAGIAFTIGAWLLYRNTPSNVYKARPVYERERWFGSLIPLAFISSMLLINNQTDIVMLGIFKSPTEVGIYRVAVQMAVVAAFGLEAVNLVVAPRFSTLYTKKEMNRFQHLATRSAQAMFTFNLFITGFFILFGKMFLNLIFGKDFIYAYIPLLILLVGQMINSAAGSVGIILNMTGHEKDTACGMTISAGINVLLNLILIPHFGIKGAAIATAISMITWNLVLWWFVRKRLDINSLAFDLGTKG